VAQRREEMRAADVDRQFVAERLKAALDEGRLSLMEYDDRLKETYSAKTYGDLDQVIADLPGFTPVENSQLAQVPQPMQPLPHQEPVYPTAAAREEIAGSPMRAIPKWLVGVWGAWLIAVLVNVVIWALASISSGQLLYFWPMWVGGPWGAVLVAGTITGLANGDHEREVERRARRREERRRGH